MRQLEGDVNFFPEVIEKVLLKVDFERSLQSIFPASFVRIYFDLRLRHHLLFMIVSIHFVEN